MHFLDLNDDQTGERLQFNLILDTFTSVRIDGAYERYLS